jgi:mRNA-degrading endonuclease RelE of RelBE toxin-antitoxin system
MEFRIADTFTDSLAKLTGEEQKAVKTTAFDLQLNPASPGMQLHKLDKARDARFWSVRVGRDVRLIVQKTEASLLLCYVDHHDKAYQWAERRKLETHPKTGAAQLVEIRETVQEITVPKYVEVLQPAPPRPALFAHLSHDDLLGYGVPLQWIDDVRLANEDTVLQLAGHLPAEAGEALLELATGGTPQPAQPAIIGADPFAHPDAQRRFRIMGDAEELERALEYPWEKWAIFLHPAQLQLVERDYSGPARVAGSAGTGKTVVALHRAVFLARTNQDARILLATFSNTLASALRTKLIYLIGNQPRLGENIEVYDLNAIGRRLYEMQFGPARIAPRDTIRALLTQAANEISGHKFREHFLMTEWEEVVDAWQVQNWEAYRVVQRLGRKTRLPEQQRQTLWSIFDRVRSGLKTQGLMTYAELLGCVASEVASRQHPPFDFAVIDEAQDVSIAQLRFLAALGAGRPNSLFFAGDLGQRIFGQPFSWKALGVDVRGRSRTLHYQLSNLAPDQSAGRPLTGPGGLRRRRQHRGAEGYGFRFQRPGSRHQCFRQHR